MKRIKQILVVFMIKAIQSVLKHRKAITYTFIVSICAFSILVYERHVSREKEREEAEQKVNLFRILQEKSVVEFYSGLELQNVETIQYDVTGYDQIYLSGRVVNKSRYDYEGHAGYGISMHGDMDSYGIVKLNSINFKAAPDLRLKILGYDCPSSQIDDDCTIVYDELVETRILDLPKSQARDFRLVELVSANNITPIGQLIFDAQVYADVDFSYHSFLWGQYWGLPEEFK